MSLIATVSAHAGQIKSAAAAVLVTIGVFMGVLGFSKLPAKVDAVADKLQEHTHSAAETNKKLDTLICLQAKLDTPLRCVAQNK